MTKIYYAMINGRKYIYSKCEDCGVDIRYRSDSNKRKCNVCVYKYREYKVVEHYQPNKVKFCGGESYSWNFINTRDIMFPLMEKC